MALVELLLLRGREHDCVARGVVADELLAGLMDGIILNGRTALQQHLVVGSQHLGQDLVQPGILAA